MHTEPHKRFAHLSRIKSWYARFERPLSSVSLIGGFVFDAVTLKRVDELWENFWVVVHLAVVAVCIVLINLDATEGAEEKDVAARHFWYVNILQFFFGGLLSTFLVFYFRSGNVATSWPFFLILAAAFIANESLKKHYTRLTFQISLFFLSLYSFAIYLVPILFHSIGVFTFIASGVISLVFIWQFLKLIKVSGRDKFRHSALPVRLSIIIIFVAVNVLYFFNLIPPIPLSLKDSGIYHTLTVLSPGNYVAQSEDQGPFAYFKIADAVHLLPGESLYAYSAVFSPSALNTDIIHEWQRYDPTARAWITTGKVTLPVTGGRDGGYRTFSQESNFSPGDWRVNVETPRGQIIGRMRFTVIAAETEPQLVTKNVE